MMTRSLAKPLLTALLTTAIFATAASVRAADKADTNAPAAGAPKKERSNWSGKLTAVDKTAKTITVTKKDEDKVLQITSETKFRKDGKPATLEDGVIGEECGTTYLKADGTNTVDKAVSVRFGPKPESDKKKSDKKSSDKPATKD
jgi:hypothetical protein